MRLLTLTGTSTTSSHGKPEVTGLNPRATSDDGGLNLNLHFVLYFKQFHYPLALHRGQGPLVGLNLHFKQKAHWHRCNLKRPKVY